MAEIVDFTAFRDRKKADANPPASPAPFGPDIPDTVLTEIADLCIHEAQTDDFMLKLDAFLDEHGIEPK